MSTREQEIPRTSVTLGPLGLETVEWWRKANEEDEAADGCFTWSRIKRRVNEMSSSQLTRCLEEELLVDLVELLAAKVAMLDPPPPPPPPPQPVPAGPDSGVC